MQNSQPCVVFSSIYQLLAHIILHVRAQSRGGGGRALLYEKVGGGVGDPRRLGCNSIILVSLRVLMKYVTVFSCQSILKGTIEEIIIREAFLI